MCHTPAWPCASGISMASILPGDGEGEVEWGGSGMDEEEPAAEEEDPTNCKKNDLR